MYIFYNNDTYFITNIKYGKSKNKVAAVIEENVQSCSFVSWSQI